MDIQAQVAARRAELARLEAQAKADKVAQDQQRRIEDKAQREVALDAIAAEIQTANGEVRRDGDALVLVSTAPSPPPDIDGLRKSEIRRLLDREARKLWTPRDNWVVIGCIGAGVGFLTIPLAGIALILLGLARRHVINREYRDQLLQTYPEVFLSDGAA